MSVLPNYKDWRILVSPDHRTPVQTRAHSHGAVPYVIAGTGIVANGQTAYDEVSAAATSILHAKGHDLMKVFLK
jgi:2,3-bisphosphoglycerate-independent phosphoglycerate mutase